jgi:hypothetical protein
MDIPKHQPFFNKTQSSFTPSVGRDLYLDFYITAVTKEILQSANKNRRYSNINKSEMESLRKLSQDKSIIIKKADKSNTIVIMDTCDYKLEVLRHLDDKNYYEKISKNPSESVKHNISMCIEKMQEHNNNISSEFDVFPDEIRTPVFYILPKIHKKIDSALPIGYPGRPIVSACNSPTENISKYIDYVLRPHVMNLPSYIKDTTDFINKIKSKKFKSEQTLLVTLDVSSLYTNIPHDDGTSFCKHFLDKDLSGRLSSDEIATLIKLVLNNNYYKFDSDFYMQKMGTAMGSSMAPSYASLFMGKFEEDFINSQSLKPTLWLRF